MRKQQKKKVMQTVFCVLIESFVWLAHIKSCFVLTSFGNLSANILARQLSRLEANCSWEILLFVENHSRTFFWTKQKKQHFVYLECEMIAPWMLIKPESFDLTDDQTNRFQRERRFPLANNSSSFELFLSAEISALIKLSIFNYLGQCVFINDNPRLITVPSSHNPFIVIKYCSATT